MPFDQSALITTVIAGFVGWVLHGSIQFYLNRRNVRTYLTIAINDHLDVSHNNQKTLISYFKDKVRVDSKILVAPNYRADDLDSITCIKSKAIESLTQCEIIKFAHLISALREMEALCEGFCKHLQNYEERNLTISGEQHVHLSTHIDRMEKIGAQLPNNISNLFDLPREYHYNLGI